MTGKNHDYTNLLIVIGSSAGGLDPIRTIVENLPEDFQATVMVVNHRTPGHPNILKEILSELSSIKVTEPVEGEKLRCTTVYVGKPESLVEVEGSRLSVFPDWEQFRRMQNIDDLFLSAAQSAGENAVGVILSGALWDGIRGLQEISNQGGICIAQDPKEALFQSMPELADEKVDLDFIGSAEEIAQRLVKLAEGRQCKIQD